MNLLTAGANTKDWVMVTKGMTISAFTEPQVLNSELGGRTSKGMEFQKASINKILKKRKNK